MLYPCSVQKCYLLTLTVSVNNTDTGLLCIIYTVGLIMYSIFFYCVPMMAIVNFKYLTLEHEHFCFHSHCGH